MSAHTRFTSLLGFIRFRFHCYWLSSGDDTGVSEMAIIGSPKIGPRIKVLVERPATGESSKSPIRRMIAYRPSSCFFLVGPDAPSDANRIKNCVGPYRPHFRGLAADVAKLRVM
jgi:hypothetical protein